jgi:hypothetical protein
MTTTMTVEQQLVGLREIYRVFGSAERHVVEVAGDFFGDYDEVTVRAALSVLRAAGDNVGDTIRLLEEQEARRAEHPATAPKTA